MPSVLVDPATAVPEPRFHPPGNKTALSWSTFSTTATSLLAAATVAAGATGVQRVVNGATWGMAPAVATLATSTIGLYIKDGSTIIWATILNVGSNGISPYTASELNLVTTAATELSAGFSNSVATASQFVTLVYHDLGI